MARKGRRVSGILLLDKPQGMTSNQALQRARRVYDARKAGHTGSLDPLATGMLPVCFGEATKVSGFLLDADKAYQVTARFGIVTTTGDAEGEVVEECAPVALDRAAVESALTTLTGHIEQVPPMYSALKHKGRRLYDIARAGGEVERAPRPVTIHELALLALRDREADLRVRCSKGTYVRTLVEDLGRLLGVGAHVTALRRTALGPFPESEAMVDLARLDDVAAAGTAALDACLLPVDRALERWPDLHLGEDTAACLRQGQAVWIPRAPRDGWVRLYHREGRFLGMGAVLPDGRVAPKRLMALNP